MRLVIVGGGPAGMMSAIQAKLTNKYADVILLEKNEKLGKKLFITGKGRCNVTNDCTREIFMNSVVTNSKFMFAPLSAFDCQDTIRFFNQNGCLLKTERGNRVFPVSDKSSDIIKCLEKKLKEYNIKIHLETNVITVTKENNQFVLKTNKGYFYADKLVLATGGNYYQATGSTGDGYLFAEKFGHKIIQPKPSLVGFITKQKHDLAGLTLKNISASLFCNGKKVAEEFGELLFTHKGISGPTVLTLSTRYDAQKGNYKVFIDLKPALDEDTLDKRILRDFNQQLNKEFKNCLNNLLPASLAKYIIEQSKINPAKQANSVTQAERKSLLNLIKFLTFDIQAVDNADSAIVTRGGIDTKEITPKTMQSKIIDGLYVCGELLDVDAFTGGFNIQIALSTGALAGKSAVME